MRIVYYVECTVCGSEEKVPAPSSKPKGRGKTTDPVTNTPLETCAPCSIAIHEMLKRRGWQPPVDPNGSP